MKTADLILGYNSEKMIFSPATVMGLLDSDGYFGIRSVRKVGRPIMYELYVALGQIEKNIDVLLSVKNTAKAGSIATWQPLGNKQRAASLRIYAGDKYVADFFRDYVYKFPLFLEIMCINFLLCNQENFLIIEFFTFAQIHGFTNTKDLLELVSRPLRCNKNLENHDSLSKTFAL